MINGKYPFMFCKHPDGDNSPFDSSTRWYVFIAKYFSYSYYHCGWMNDDRLGNECYIPGVDLTEEEHEFTSEEEAIQFIADWWKAGKGEE